MSTVNPMSLDGKTILVTGAGQGIGLAISSLAIQLGANVVAVDLNGETLDASALDRNSFMPVVGSVTDPEFVTRTVQSAIARFGSVDGLVNNAGIIRPAMIDKMSREQWKDVLDVHVNGSFYFMQAVGRHWLDLAKAGAKTSGALVNISSDGGRRGTIGQINYSTAKSALFGMTMSAAREWGKYGVRANAVCFGLVDTQMTETVRTNPKLSEIYLSQIPLGRWAPPEEVSIPVCFLLSNGASYITGQIISVNGGYTITI